MQRNKTLSCTPQPDVDPLPYTHIYLFFIQYIIGVYDLND